VHTMVGKSGGGWRGPSHTTAIDTDHHRTEPNCAAIHPTIQTAWLVVDGEGVDERRTTVWTAPTHSSSPSIAQALCRCGTDNGAAMQSS